MQPPPSIVFWNSHAGSAADLERLRGRLTSLPHVQLRETSSGEDARRMASAVAGNCEDDDLRVVAAGGDGTVNAVINGLCEHQRRPVLGILPLGTGNDLCRSLGIPLDPELAADLLFEQRASPHPIDLARMQADQHTRIFANVSSGGNSQRVAEALTEETKQRWGAWSYLRGGLQVLNDLTGFEVTLRTDDSPPEQLRLWNVIVANGRMAAGGLPVAPEADLQDGLFDLVLIQDGTPLDMASLSVEFFMGNYLDDPRVIFRRARRIEIDSSPSMQFLADGEARVTTPVTFTLEHQALRVITSPREGRL